jgi:menaquinone-9 beta-reductase
MTPFGSSPPDVIVVGAGPAGSSAAAVLGERGRKVLLVDKLTFPREKTCGDGMTFKCLDPLRRLGILEPFLAAARFQTRGYSLWFSDYTELTVRRSMGDGAAFVTILPRYDFDDLIYGAAVRHEGVTFVPGCTARRLVTDGPRVLGVEVDVAGEGTVTLHAPLVIDASGANSALAVQAGAGNQDPTRCALALRGYYDGVSGLGDTVEFYFDEEILPGYFWIFPMSATSANIGCGTFQHIIEARKLDLRAVMARFFERHPVASRKLGGAVLRGGLKGGKIPLAIDFSSSRVRPGLILTGDAASFTDPITAEGISYAMGTGIMAAEVADDALGHGDTSATALAAYDVAWKAKFLPQFSKAPVLTTPLPKEVFASSLLRAFNGNASVDAKIGDLAHQYELMFKVKAVMKAL